MATDIRTQPEPGLASLLQGITSDFGDLIKHHLKFARAEMKSDLRQTLEAGRLFAVGVACTGIGAIVMCLMLVHLLHWLTAPAGTDPAGLPLWACHGIVGAITLASGLVLVFAGQKKMESFNPLPDQTAQAVKEDVQWLTNSK